VLSKIRDKMSSALRRVKLIQAYRKVFDTPDGQMVLSHIMREGFITETTFVAGDSHQTALNEGSRRLALGICRYALKDESQLLKIIEKGEDNV